MAAGGVLRVTRGLVVPLDELEWRFTGSGGPGGQHANTSNTRVELRFESPQPWSMDADLYPPATSLRLSAWAPIRFMSY